MERSFPEQAVTRNGNWVMNFSGQSHSVFKLHFLANDLCMTPIPDCNSHLSETFSYEYQCRLVLVVLQLCCCSSNDSPTRAEEMKATDRHSWPVTVAFRLWTWCWSAESNQCYVEKRCKKNRAQDLMRDLSPESDSLSIKNYREGISCLCLCLSRCRTEMWKIFCAIMWSVRSVLVERSSMLVFVLGKDLFQFWDGNNKCSPAYFSAMWRCMIDILINILNISGVINIFFFCSELYLLTKIAVFRGD